MSIEERLNVYLAGICGAFGGMIKFSMGYLTNIFIINLLEAGITAMVCGALGVAGKELYAIVKNVYIKRYKKNEKVP